MASKRLDFHRCKINKVDQSKDIVVNLHRLSYILFSYRYWEPRSFGLFTFLECQGTGYMGRSYRVAESVFKLSCVNSDCSLSIVYFFYEVTAPQVVLFPQKKLISFSKVPPHNAKDCKQKKRNGVIMRSLIFC